MKEFDAEDSAGPGGGGATGIFGTIPPQSFTAVPDSPAAKTQEPEGPAAHVPLMSLPSSPAPPAPSPTPSGPIPSASAGGGFTQLLRTLTLQEPIVERETARPSAITSAAISPDEETKAKAAALQPVFSGPVVAPREVSQPPAAVPPAAGSFTQMFDTIRAEVPAPAAAPVQVPQAAVPVPSAAAVAPGGLVGFTQLFQSLDSLPPMNAPAPPEPVLPVLAHSPAESSEQGRGAVQTPAVPERTAATSSPAEGFTQLFQALQSDAVETPTLESAVPALPSAPVTPAHTLPPTPQPQPPSYPGGGITQLLRAIDMSTLQPAKAPAPIECAPVAPAAVVPDPVLPTPLGQANVSSTSSAPAPAVIAEPPSSASLTAMFQAVPSPALKTVPAPAPVPTLEIKAAPPAPAAETHTPPREAEGSFTQMFQALDQGASNQQVPSSPAKPQGSFTQFFSSAAMQPAREASQADAFPPMPLSTPARTPAPSPGYGEQAPSPWEEPRFSTPPPARPAFSASGYAEPQQRSPQPPAPSDSGSMGGGGLTQMLRALDSPGDQPKPASSFTPPPAAPIYPKVDLPPPSQSGATTAFRLPQSQLPAAPATMPQAAGPGEFTRIIQASALRESARQGGGAAVGAAAPSPAPATPSGFSMPSGFPAMPPAPAMPTMPGMGGGGGGASFAAPQMPAMPALPTITLPPVPAPASAGAGASKYLPILLIIIIVLLVAVLLAVVLLMKH